MSALANARVARPYKVKMAASAAPVLDPDASVPLPESVARDLNAFHRLMRSHCLGLCLFVVIAIVLAFQPLFAVAPVLLLISWMGVVDVAGMQRFFDYCSGWYMAVILVSTR